jgi:hypothetical protein
MVSHRVTFAAVLVLAISCLGQDRPSDVLTDVQRFVNLDDFLSNARVSGSLSYWGQRGCTSHTLYPQIPYVRRSNNSGPPSEVLQQMFADDTKMRVTQEPGGLMRMAETDIPTDLLDVKIRHLSFHVSGSGADIFHGPNMALWIIMSAPEVKAFKKAHNIGPFSDVVDLPGDAGSSDKPRVSGVLDNVTVSQALDYVLQTFPGIWLYGNCRAQDGSRMAFFWFLEHTH